MMWLLLSYCVLLFGLWGICFLPTTVIYVRRLHMQGLGLSLPGVILLKYPSSETVLRHELTHQKQMRRWSPFGVALRLGYHYGRGFWQAYRSGNMDSILNVFWDLWRKNPLEIEANAAMHCQEPLPRHWVLNPK